MRTCMPSLESGAPEYTAHPASKACTQEGKMEDEGEDQVIATFQSVTGADTATAQHVLEAHAWDLNRSVEFFLEQSAAPVSQLHGLRAHAVSIDEDDEAADPTFTLPVPATRIQGNDSPLQARPAVPEQHEGLLGNGAGHDDELRRALAESARDAALPPGEDHSDQAGDDAPTLLESSDDDSIGNAGPKAPASSRTAHATGLNGQAVAHPSAGAFADMDTDVQRRQRRSRPAGAAAALQQDLRQLEALGQRVGVPEASGSRCDPFEDLMQGSSRQAPFPMAPPVLGNGRIASEDLQLPDFINVEEARMLEAAMLGIPYQARPSSRSAPWEPRAPPAPEVVAGRQIRDEQDAAYQESLLADMEKAQQAKRQHQEAERAEEAKRSEQEHAEQAQRDYERLISSKQVGLPEEAPVEDASTVTIMVRLPNGTRASRRFARMEKLQTLFDWVDITVAPDIKPGTYHLMSQFPRRQLQAQSAETLQEAGLTEKQEALFLNIM